MADAKDDDTKAKEIDRSKITTEEYYDIEAKRYASDNWVSVVATKFIKILSDIRPFKENDVIFDIGCGPANTGSIVLKQCKASKYFGIDLSVEFVKIAKEKLSNEEFKSTEISIEKMDMLTDNFQLLLDNKIKGIDFSYMSLVTEYLSKDNIIKICTQIVNTLNVGGIFACMDWGEHLTYPPIYGNGLHWNQGITKKDWLLMAAKVVENIENGARIIEDEKKGVKKASRSKYTVSVWCSTFEIKLGVKDTNSYLHYLVFRKDAVNEVVNK
eukprot:142919_1